MKLSKKGQIATLPTTMMGKIIVVMIFLIVILMLLWIFATPAFGKVTEWISSLW